MGNMIKQLIKQCMVSTWSKHYTRPFCLSRAVRRHCEQQAQCRNGPTQCICALMGAGAAAWGANPLCAHGFASCTVPSAQTNANFAQFAQTQTFALRVKHWVWGRAAT
jgi:hypothetical protein